MSSDAQLSSTELGGGVNHRIALITSCRTAPLPHLQLCIPLLSPLFPHWKSSLRFRSLSSPHTTSRPLPIFPPLPVFPSRPHSSPC